MNSPEPINLRPEPVKSKRRPTLFLAGCLIAVSLFGCLVVIGLATGIYIYAEYGDTWSELTVATEEAWSERAEVLAETATPAAGVSEPADDVAANAMPTAVPTLAFTLAVTETGVSRLELSVPTGVTQAEVSQSSEETLKSLYRMEYPTYDYYDSAVSFGLYNQPRTVTLPTYTTGDVTPFNVDGEVVEATLVAVTDHTYFWVDERLDLDAGDVIATANRFEAEYYEPVISLFGQVWSPGMDNDPRISILHIEGVDTSELGYFTSEDEYPATLLPSSNERELIYLNMSDLDIGGELYMATLIHEMQHLVQWYVDEGEAVWLNEGLSQLAEIMLGFDNTADTVEYLQNPSTSLNTWSYDDDDVFAHYAASYLFSVYLWEQLGEAAVQELARHPANGLVAVRAVLEGYASDRSLEQFLADWTVANYLDDVTAGPRYHVSNLDFRRPAFYDTVDPNSFPYEIEANLSQFGAHYIDLTEVRGRTTIDFAGDTVTPLVATAPRNGESFWYAPAVDGTDAQLTAAFDLTKPELESATFSFSVWYDLEPDYDFAYLSISTDDGLTWFALPLENGRTGDFGEGFNGRSSSRAGAQDGWLKETISLNPYLGEMVQLRFSVLTDSDTTGQGFAVDNIELPEYGYQGTFEADDAGWLANGFVRTGPFLPQRWSVMLIEEGVEDGVQPMILDDLNRGRMDVDFGKSGGVLVIMPQTPFVKSHAAYWLKVTQ